MKASGTPSIRKGFPTQPRVTRTQESSALLTDSEPIPDPNLPEFEPEVRNSIPWKIALLGLCALTILTVALMMGEARIAEERDHLIQKVKTMASELQMARQDWALVNRRSYLSSSTNEILRLELVERESLLSAFSNRLSANLTESVLNQMRAEATARAATVELDQRETQVRQLETDRIELHKQLDFLHQELEERDKLIAGAEKALEEANGSRRPLVQKLKELITEKAQLESRIQQLSKQNEDLIAAQQDFKTRALRRRVLSNFDRKAGTLDR